MIDILLLGDAPDNAQRFQTRLEATGLACRITCVQTQAEFEAVLDDGKMGIILADYQLTSFDGLSALRMARERHPEIPFIFVSDSMGEASAIEALTQGAADYVLTHNLSRLAPAVHRALREARLQRERRQTQEAEIRLNEQLYFFQQLLDSVPLAIYYKDLDGLYLGCNAAFEAFIGVPKKDIVGKTVHELVQKERADKHSEMDLVLHRQPGVQTYEISGIAKDGKYKDVIFHKATFLDANDCVAGTIGTLVDITERKQAEEELKRSVNFANALMNAVPTPVFYKDRDGCYLGCNLAFSELMGVTADEIKGKRVDELWPSEHAEMYHRKDLELIQTPAHQVYEFEVKDKSGKTRPVIFAKDVFYDENGRVDGIIGAFLDISSIKEKEAELQRLRNYLSNILNSMPSVLVTVDTEGNVTQWNHQAEQITGLTFEKARSRPLAAVFPHLTDEMERIRASIHEHRVISSPKVARNVGHETRYENITIFPLMTNMAEGAVIRVDDITDQVRLEEMMIQNEKMLTVGGLAAGMAHEINNPLAGMLQTAEVMANRLSTGFNIPANREAAEAAGTSLEAIERFMDARSIPRMLTSIITSGRRVADIVGNMLSFARKGDEGASHHYLDELLDKTLELAATDYNLKKQHDFKKIAIVKDYADNLPAVPCQGNKIQQVLLNIFGNGAQAMRAAGTPTPRFIIRTHHDRARNMACMEIEDNGPGMDEATRKKVFDPFFTTKPQGLGTGLGLSVSYFIITENHNGEMTVESQPGVGAKFIIRLPVEV